MIDLDDATVTSVSITVNDIVDEEIHALQHSYLNVDSSALSGHTHDAAH